MQKVPLVLDAVLRNTLLEVDSGYCRFLSSYAPAALLVDYGYCEWKDGDPDTWQLELTDMGVGAVAMIKCPEAVESITMEKVDAVVCRILQNGELRGFAVRYPNDKWVAFDENSLRMTEQEFSSAEAVLLMVKMFEAEMALSCREGVYADTFPLVAAM